MSMRGFRCLKSAVVVPLAVILTLSVVLMLRPITGTADNGDFARIMNSTGLFYLSDAQEDRYFGYVNRLYGTGLIIPMGGGYLSTQIPLVLLALSLSRNLSGAALFDIRFLGFVYILLLAFAIYLAVRGFQRRWGSVVLVPAFALILVFCDTGYTAYFNSLYGEPVTFVFLLIMTGAALLITSPGNVVLGREKMEGESVLPDPPDSLWMLAVFCVAAIFFTGAKLQNVPAGLLAALLCIRLACFRKDSVWKGVATASAISVLVVSLACYISVPYEIKVCNKYQTVFYGILNGSEDPASDLLELGMDPALASLAGTNYFMEAYPVNIRTKEFKKMIYDNVNYGKVGRFYLRHPERFAGKLAFAAKYGFQLKPGFGNYEKYPGIRYKQTSGVLEYWSRFKLRVLPHTLPFTAGFFAAFLLVLFYEYTRAPGLKRRFLLEFFGFVAATGMMQFVLTVIADGQADIGKHLFLFNLCFDLLFLSALAYLAWKAVRLTGYFRNRRLAGTLQPERQ